MEFLTLWKARSLKHRQKVLVKYMSFFYFINNISIIKNEMQCLFLICSNMLLLLLFFYDKRYIMLRNSSGLYSYGIYEHQEGWPAFSLTNTRIAFKLRKDKYLLIFFYFLPPIFNLICSFYPK